MTGSRLTPAKCRTSVSWLCSRGVTARTAATCANFADCRGIGKSADDDVAAVVIHVRG